MFRIPLFKAKPCVVLPTWSLAGLVYYILLHLVYVESPAVLSQIVFRHFGCKCAIFSIASLKACSSARIDCNSRYILDRTKILPGREP